MIDPSPYRDDLAFIHDAGFGHFAASAAGVLLDALKNKGVRTGTVVDLGCGSGILSQAVSDAGYDVLGVDLSSAMLDLARQRAPRAEFRQGSVLDTELPPCVAVTAVGEIVNYLFDTTNGVRKLRRLFRRVHAALVPGGVFLFDIATPGRVPHPSGVWKSHVGAADWSVLVTAEEDRKRNLLTRHIVSFRKVGELYRRDEEVHRLRLIPRTDAAKMLREVGFRVRVLRAYGSQALPKGMIAFQASA